MIDYMLLNLGFLASNMNLKPEDVVSMVPVPDDSAPPKPESTKTPARYGTGHIRSYFPMTIAESFYSPIRRSDFL